MLFRISTEDKNRQGIEREVSRFFPGFTVYTAAGFWQGTKEASLIIEIDTDKSKEGLIVSVARTIKRINQQQAVLVQKFLNNSKFI